MLADQLGYSSLWYGEHVALPLDFDPSKYPGEAMMFDPDSVMLDPFTLLAFVAGTTTHVRLGTGIAILPLHDPLIKPVQRPRIPVHVGGHGPASLRRAARYEGWYGSADTPDDAARIRGEILRQRSELGLGDESYEFSVLFFRAPDRGELNAYEAVGVDQVVVTPWAIADPSNALRRIEEYAAEVGIEPPTG